MDAAPKPPSDAWAALAALGQAFAGATAPSFSDETLERLDTIRGACWRCLDALGALLEPDGLPPAAARLTRLARGRASLDEHRPVEGATQIKKDALPHIHVPRPVLFIQPEALVRALDLLSVRVGDLVAFQDQPGGLIVLGVVTALEFRGLEGVSAEALARVAQARSAPFLLAESVARAGGLDELANEALAGLSPDERERLERALVFSIDEVDYSPDPEALGKPSDEAGGSGRRRAGRRRKQSTAETALQQLRIPGLVPPSLLVGASLTGVLHTCSRGQVLPILDPVVSGAIVNLRPGDTCFAIWPDTTVFYAATVLDSAQRQSLSTGTNEAFAQPLADEPAGGAQDGRIGSEWHTLVKFDGDSADEAYSRYVYSSFVLPVPALWPK